MIIEYVRYRIPPDQQEAFERAYANAQSSLDDSDYCLGYELTHCVEDPQNYILRIQWTSQDDHERGFRSSPEFQRFLLSVRPYVERIEEMRHYALTSVRSSGDAE